MHTICTALATLSIASVLGAGSARAQEFPFANFPRTASPSSPQGAPARNSIQVVVFPFTASSTVSLPASLNRSPSDDYVPPKTFGEWAAPSWAPRLDPERRVMLAERAVPIPGSPEQRR